MQENNINNNPNDMIKDWQSLQFGSCSEPTKDNISGGRKKFIIAAIAVVAVIIIIALSFGNGMSGIEIVEEHLVTNPYYAIIGNNLYPIVVVKVKNTSNTTKKVSFEANFYADGNLLGSDQASFVTLAPGDEAFLHAQSNKGYRAWSSHEYSYKITKWHVYS